MSLDVRTRIDGEVPPLEPARFFTVDLPAALERTEHLRRPGLARLDLRPLAIAIDDETFTLVSDGDVSIRTGAVPGALVWPLSRAELGAIASDESTPIGLYAGGSLRVPIADLPLLLDWWLVLRSALDERPLYHPGSVAFADRSGGPLDLRRSFRPDDDREEMSHFLHEAGFLHVTGAFDEAEMEEVSRDMDRAAASYRDGDGKSWWASTSDGERRLVRMQGFDERSEATARLIRDDRLLGLADLSGAGHVHTGLDSNRIEALTKPLGVVAGLSDLPWHKDCSLGRHGFDCCSLTVGISVTGADADSGQLRVVAGSHRALLWPARLVPGHHDLPEIDLPTRTGDLTLHTSCTLHMSQAPVLRERRVMYTSFRLPDRSPEATRAARARLREVREMAPVTVSQPPSEVAASR